MAEEGTPKTRFLRVVDNSKFRMAFTVFLCLLMFGDLVLAGMSFKYYPKDIYGALAWQIVLSVISIAYSAFFLWRNLDGVTKKRSRLYLGLNAGMICLWLSAFFSLAIMLGKTGNGSKSASSSDNTSNNNNNQGNNNGNTQRLAIRADTAGQAQSANFYPAIGCVVMNLFFSFMFLVNLAYIYFRMTTLFPKYAEIVEDGHAFDTQMTDTHEQHQEQHHDEESHGAANGSAQGGYSSYGVYEGQNEYRPGGRVDRPARYDAELEANDAHNTYSGRISPIPYPIPAAGENPYQNTGYQGQTAYAGQTAYGAQPHPGRQVSPTPYPRSSVIGNNDYRDV